MKNNGLLAACCLPILAINSYTVIQLGGAIRLLVAFGITSLFFLIGRIFSRTDD